MNNYGEVDFACLEKIGGYHVEAGSNALVSVGTTGESATLSIEENVKVIEKTVEFAKRSYSCDCWRRRKCDERSNYNDKIITRSGVAG